MLIETQGKKILIDPGIYEYEESLLTSSWDKIDILLITHKHGDHYHLPAVERIVSASNPKFYTSQEVADKYPEITPTQIVKEGDVIDINDIKIETVKAVHGFQPFLKEANNIIHENIGFIVDDGDKRVYQTSDTISFDHNYKCDVVFVPVCNHGLVMDPFSASLFAKMTEASLVIPMHYDNPKFPADMDLVKKEFTKQDLNFKILDIGESVEI